MDRFLIVCAGSAVGGGTRYLVGLGTAVLGLTGFPWATLIVNVVGSFLITMIAHVAIVTSMSTNMRLLLTTGFLGGFTTYSAFAYESLALAERRSLAVAACYAGLTIVGCFLACAAGIALMRRVISP